MLKVITGGLGIDAVPGQDRGAAAQDAVLLLEGNDSGVHRFTEVWPLVLWPCHAEKQQQQGGSQPVAS